MGENRDACAKEIVKVLNLIEEKTYAGLTKGVDSDKLYHIIYEVNQEIHRLKTILGTYCLK